MDQRVGEIGIDSPIAPLVGVRQCGASDRAAKTTVVKLAPLCSQAGFDIPQTVTVGQLSKCHGKKLIPARQSPYASVAVVSLHATTEVVVGDKLHDLGKNSLSLIHSYFPRRGF